jgi:glycosyltransferase involved in cell wall biosynthesis
MAYSPDMKLAFVIPWFGADIPGGAEKVCYHTAGRLRDAGLPVEILTTCIKQLGSDWSKNYHQPGVDIIDGMTVRRFGVQPRDTEEFLRINDRLMRRLPVTPEEQAIFVRQMIRCDDLTSFIGAHRHEYLYAFIPYLFSTTYWGALACPESTVIIPCLHDEGYAYLNLYKPMFESARGLLFHSRAEMNLANRLYRLQPTSQALIGAGIETSVQADADRFREKYHLDRFLLYIGRKDAGKNLPLLMKCFCRYKDLFPGDLKLVLIGAGATDIPEEHEHEVIDLGVVPTEDKGDACAAALALCQPSINESFSLVLMEAWANGTPVLVHEDCAATREHCLASSGGLFFSSFEDFCGCLNCFVENRVMTRRMGQAGRQYVRANFTWDLVVHKYLAALKQWGFGF